MTKNIIATLLILTVLYSFHVAMSKSSVEACSKNPDISTCKNWTFV